MIKMNKNQLKRLQRNKPLLAASVVLFSSFAYAYGFTDIIRCRDCAYRKGSVIIRNYNVTLEVNTMKTFYTYTNQTYDVNTVTLDAIKRLVNDDKVKSYAKKNNITASKAEIDDLYNQRVGLAGTEADLLNKVKNMYGFGKQEYRKVLETDIIDEKVQNSLNTPLADWLAGQ